MSYPEFRQGLSSRLKEAGPELIIVSIFTVSRFIFFLKGGSFLAKPLSFAKQYLDPVLLKTDLLESLLYLHSQPPFFNLFLGTVLKLSPVPALSYELLFRTVGILIPLIFYGILVSLGIRRLFALLAAIAFMLNPTLILYENLLYYTYFEGFLVLLSIFFLLRWSMGKKFFDLFLFWTSLLCLGMMRSLFHPVFFLFIAVFLALYLRRAFERQRLAKTFFLSSCVVLIPILLLCLKNVYFFGFFGTSSWTGMSLWIKANGYTPDDLEVFHSRGIISSLAVQAELEPFQPIENFSDDSKLRNVPCHHPADCNEVRSTGRPNFNYSGYIYLSKQLLKDSMSLISYNPPLFAFFTAGSYCLTLWHSSDSVHALFKENMEIVEKLEKFYRFLYFGFMGVENRHSDPGIWKRTVVITIFFLFFYMSTFINLLRKDSLVHPGIKIVCLFCLLIHSYTVTISSLIEFGENNRFRFPVDAAFLVLMAGNIVIWKMLISKRFGERGSA
jgi:hypothetical protein